MVIPVGVDGRRRIDNITDTALTDYRRFGNDVTKDDIFFCDGRASALAGIPGRRPPTLKMLPRIPKVKNIQKSSRRQDGHLRSYIGYETVEPYPLVEDNTADGADPYATYRVQKMTVVKPADRVVYNSHLTLSGILKRPTAACSVRGQRWNG